MPDTTMLPENECCHTCRHWHTAEPGRDGQIRATAMLHLGFASCKHGQVWHYLPAVHHCPKYRALSAAAQTRRNQECLRLRREKRC